MKSLRLFLSLPLIAALAACGGGKGSPAPAPTNFSMTAQDSQFKMTWDAVAGVEYWVFCDPNQTTIDSHTSNHPPRIYYRGIYASGSQVTYYATGLTNGTQYACTVNGRFDGGPGGADATPQQGTPGYGGTWSSGTSPAWTGMTLKSVAYGLPSGQSLTSDQFVAVGTGGQIAVSTAVDSEANISWTAPQQPLSNVTGSLSAVTFYPAGNRFVAAATDGKVVYATNAFAWSYAGAMALAAGESVNALASGSASMVAVGDAGLIRTSADGINWSASNASVPAGYASINLRSVAYAASVTGTNGLTTPYWIAVGDSGSILVSLDNGLSWAAASSGVAQTLRAVAVLPVINTSTNVTTYVLAAVGDAGSIVYSSDNGANWQVPSSVLPSPGAFVALSAGKGQFMAVDASGRAYTSTDGASWSGSASGISTPAAAIRYTPSVAGVSNAWMVFDAAGNQRIAK